MHDVGEIVARLSAHDLDAGTRRSLLLALTRALASGARAAGAVSTLSGRWALEVLTEDVAPRLPVRDLLTLRSHHGGLSGDELAADLVRQAAVSTAVIGAVAGALVAVETVAPPTLVGIPAQLLAETLVIVAIEVKLVAELHVVYGRAPRGGRREVTVAYLGAWASRRAAAERGGLVVAAALSAAMRQQVRKRVVRKLARNLSTLAPFLAGAVAGAELNRRETRALGQALMRDLRGR